MCTYKYVGPTGHGVIPVAVVVVAIVVGGGGVEIKKGMRGVTPYSEIILRLTTLLLSHQGLVIFFSF